MASPAQPKVAVSYSWSEERSGTNAGAVDLFCKSLTEAGVTVVRDVDELKHGQCISEFMGSIGAADFLCVFLSDDYLRSPNCMHELLVAWQRSKDNPDEFRQRVKVWVMPGMASIHEQQSRRKYMTYWTTERDRLKEWIDSVASDGLAPAELESFRRIKEFAEHVDEMLCFFANHLSPDSAEEFQSWIQSHFPARSPATDNAALAAVYENIIAEIESVLNRRQALQQFLSSSTAGLVQQEAGTWRLASAASSGSFDVCEHLAKIVRKLQDFRGQSDDWRALSEVCGGLVVLAIDKEWVLRQKANARSDSAEFPADSESIRVGSGRQANLLHLVTCALADGRARLEKVFGKPPLDEFRMPDAPQVMRGISEPDQVREVKLHFIRFILGPDVPIEEGNPQQIQILFNRTKNIIAAAFRDDHTPYVATGDSYKPLTQLIRKHLKVEDLLLIHPSGQDPGELLVDNVRVLRFLGTIFDTVQAKSVQ